ncbi:hypothetical protein [Methyloterricola oryzae]|uniref:hypothetical protein n=1 Tax=Methyloterricola oryzae TaxID=1495050 RepID=UPI0005EBC53B|nr:hypothetical protein [Methyloterricola oryzae]
MITDLLLDSVTAPGIEVIELVTEQQRMSYLLGVRLARGLNRDAVDFNLLVGGLRDAVNNCPIDV